MFIITAKFDKKKLILGVLILVVLVAAALLLFLPSDESASAGSFDAVVKTNEQRVKYLESFGWKVSEKPIEEQTVIIPKDFSQVYAAVCGAGRALGYVCAPSMMQAMLPRVLGASGDLETYRRNRDLLYGSLVEMGFRCVRPDGAFYLFVESPEPDANAFCDRARAYELLLVPSDSFGCEGYVRVSYCVSTDQIRRSLPAFERLATRYWG